MWYTWLAGLPGQRHCRGTLPAMTDQPGQRATWDVGLWVHTFSQLHTDIFDEQMLPNTLPLHNSQTLKVPFTIETPRLSLDVHSSSHACTTWALHAVFGQKISTRLDDRNLETPEGGHRPGEEDDSLGVYLQDIVNDLHHELDTIHATVGTTLSEPQQGALTAVPLAFQLV